MGHIFELQRPPQPLNFTGERFTTARSGLIEIEHLHRYFLARELCNGKSVLDVAAGEGYGTTLLAQKARSAVGLEYDISSVLHATHQYSRTNLQFLCGDARNLPFAPASFDAVVSFETLEHIDEQDQFLAEIKRILVAEGVLCISTPDRDVYSPTGQPANPFHVCELTRDDFLTSLKAHFRFVELYVQRPFTGSAIVAGSGQSAPGTVLTFERRDSTHIEQNVGMPRSLYFIALASDGPLPSTFSSSLYIHTSDLNLADSMFETAREIEACKEEHSRLKAELDRLRKERDMSSAQAEMNRARSEFDWKIEQVKTNEINLRSLLLERLGGQLETQRVELEREYQPQIQELQYELKKTTADLTYYKTEYHRAISSRSWKITRPLREGFLFGLKQRKNSGS